MTASIIVSMLCAYLMCFSVMFWLISRRLTGQRMGMNVFAVGHLLLSSAYILQLLGVGVALGHTLTLAAPIAYWIASMRFFGRQARFWKPILIFSAVYSATQFLAQQLGGTLAQYVLLSGCACVLFFVMSAIGTYGIRSFAKDFAKEMLLFVFLLGGFSVLNGIKFFKLVHEGMAAVDMGTPFQTVFYIYMISMVTVLPPTMIWLVLRRLTDELRVMALRDPLTQLLNRRGLTEGLEAYFRSRNSSPAHLLMIDIDHFKNINDSYGHKAGDMVLCHIAQVLKKITRQGDLICRLGGEEFAVVCLDTGEPGAPIVLAERARIAIADSQCMIDHPVGSLSYTATIGISHKLYSAADLEAAVQQADQALYHGKKSGRNRVEHLAEAAHTDNLEAPLLQY